MQDPAKKQVTMAYLEHLELCKNSRLGMLVYPEKGEMLKFKRLESLHHHPMILYLDFETSSQKLNQVMILKFFEADFFFEFIKKIAFLQLCHCCVELYKAARGPYRESVVKTCAQEKHVRLPGAARCTTCLQESLEAISNHARLGLCCHQKIRYVKDGEAEDYLLCQTCLDDVCQPYECDHSKTEILSSMKPISWSASLVETMGGDLDQVYPRTVKERTHIAASDDEDILPAFWKWLESLRGLIYETWKGKFVDVQDCVLSAQEELDHENAHRCYVCLESFKSFENDNGRGDDDCVLDFVVGGCQTLPPRQKKCIKVLDHSHQTGLYRGKNHFNI